MYEDNKTGPKRGLGARETEATYAQKKRRAEEEHHRYAAKHGLECERMLAHKHEAEQCRCMTAVRQQLHGTVQFAGAHKYFEKVFEHDEYGLVCSVCDRFWFRSDIKTSVGISNKWLI